jgi:hypothetical protein
MQVRFKCPACKGTHIADIPETTIHMTCSLTNKALKLRLTAGGDVKSAVVGAENDQSSEETEEE